MDHFETSAFALATIRGQTQRLDCPYQAFHLLYRPHVFFLLLLASGQRLMLRNIAHSHFRKRNPTNIAAPARALPYKSRDTSVSTAQLPPVDAG
jgi:hypothetical protein